MFTVTFFGLNEHEFRTFIMIFLRFFRIDLKALSYQEKTISINKQSARSQQNLNEVLVACLPRVQELTGITVSYTIEEDD